MRGLAGMKDLVVEDSLGPSDRALASIDSSPALVVVMVAVGVYW